MTETNTDGMDNAFAARPKSQSTVAGRRPLSPYDYTIEGARLGSLTGRQLKELVTRLQHKSGPILAERLMAENDFRIDRQRD